MHTTTSSEDRSYLRAPRQLHSSYSIDGTTAVEPTRHSCTAWQNDSGVKCSASTSPLPRTCEMVANPDAAAWYSGATTRCGAPWRSGIVRSSPANVQSDHERPMSRMAPLGVPVVPEVKMTTLPPDSSPTSPSDGDETSSASS